MIKNRKYGSFLTILIILFTAVIMNISFYFFFKRFDFTEGKIYSLSESSKNLVSELEEELKIKCFFSNDLPPQLKLIPSHIKNNLEEYRAYSNGKLTYEFINPFSIEFSELIMKYQLPSAQVQVLEKDEFKVKRIFMGIVMTYGDRHEIIPFVQSGDMPVIEYEISSRIKKLISESLPSIGILTGFSSTSFNDMRTAMRILLSQYKVDEIDLISTVPDPDVHSAFIIAGPEKDFSKEQLRAIDNYVIAGGRAGFFIDKTKPDLEKMGIRDIRSNIDSLTVSYGFKVNNDLVGDRQAGLITVRRQKGFFSFVDQLRYPFIPQITELDRDNPVTRRLDPVNLYFPSSLDLSYSEGNNTDINIIARSSENSFTQTENYYIFADRDISDYTYDRSHLPLIALIEGSFRSFSDSSVTGETTRMAISGNSRFFLDGIFQNDSDIDLFLNIVDWLTADDSLIGIRSKNIEFRPLKDVSETGRLIIKLLNLISVPFIITVTGLMKWIKTRSRKDFSL